MRESECYHIYSKKISYIILLVEISIWIYNKYLTSSFLLWLITPIHTLTATIYVPVPDNINYTITSKHSTRLASRILMHDSIYPGATLELVSPFKNTGNHLAR